MEQDSSVQLAKASPNAEIVIAIHECRESRYTVCVFIDIKNDSALIRRRTILSLTTIIYGPFRKLLPKFIELSFAPEECKGQDERPHAMPDALQHQSSSPCFYQDQSISRRYTECQKIEIWDELSQIELKSA
jgi:hypothetical protein